MSHLPSLLKDSGALKALTTYHESLSTRLNPNPILITTNPDITAVIGSTHAFTQLQSPLHQLEEILGKCETFIDDKIAGRTGVEDMHVSYVRELGGWLVSYRDALQYYGDDVPVLQRYVRLVKEHVDGGKTPMEAAKEDPGWDEFQRMIGALQSPEWVFEGSEGLEPPIRSRHPESDSDEVVWLCDYYGELLEVRDLFRNAKFVFVHFVGWVLSNMPTVLPPEVKCY